MVQPVQPLPPGAQRPREVVTPPPTPEPTPRPVLPPGPPQAMKRQMVLERFADRRQGTDRRLVLLVMFTGVISVSAVAALKGRMRR
ncbi:hypothetical protein ACFQX6_43210 [Streptosporangium lutulentum]